MMIDEFCELIGIKIIPIGVYDAPDPDNFAPLAERQLCIFGAYDAWQQGQTLKITNKNKGCPGCGYWLTGTETFPSREAFVNFLYNKEGLRESSDLMDAWLKANPPYNPENKYIMIGPVRNDLVEYLKTVTFFVNADQLSILSFGAVYHSHPDDTQPVIAPFGSGCGQMLPMFKDIDKPQALIGATDIAMRNHLPADQLAFTVTVPMLNRLLSLDKENSFLGKPFLARLRKARTPPS